MAAQIAAIHLDFPAQGRSRALHQIAAGRRHRA
jgi:hypothetical protein